jgi:cytochrome-b5 reductase
LAQIEPISHNTSIFRFALPEGHNAGLSVASCVLAKHQKPDGPPIVRPYTPVSEEEVKKKKKKKKKKKLLLID